MIEKAIPMVRDRGGNTLWRPDTRLVVPPPKEPQSGEQLSPTQRIALMDLADFVTQITHTQVLVINGTDADKKSPKLVSETKQGPFAEVYFGKERKCIPGKGRTGGVNVEAGVIGLARHGIPTVRFEFSDGDTPREFEVTASSSRDENLRPMTSEDYAEIVGRLTLSPQSQILKDIGGVAEIIPGSNNNNGLFKGIVARGSTTSMYTVTDKLSPDLNLSGRPTGIRALIEIDEIGTDFDTLLELQTTTPSERPEFPVKILRLAFLGEGLAIAIEGESTYGVDKVAILNSVNRIDPADEEKYFEGLFALATTAKARFMSDEPREEVTLVAVSNGHVNRDFHFVDKGIISPFLKVNPIL